MRVLRYTFAWQLAGWVGGRPYQSEGPLLHYSFGCRVYYHFCGALHYLHGCAMNWVPFCFLEIDFWYQYNVHCRINY